MLLLPWLYLYFDLTCVFCCFLSSFCIIDVFPVVIARFCLAPSEANPVDNESPALRLILPRRIDWRDIFVAVVSNIPTRRNYWRRVTNPASYIGIITSNTDSTVSPVIRNNCESSRRPRTSPIIFIFQNRTDFVRSAIPARNLSRPQLNTLSNYDSSEESS